MAKNEKNEKSKKKPMKKRALKDLPADGKGDDVKGGPIYMRKAGE